MFLFSNKHQRQGAQDVSTILFLLIYIGWHDDRPHWAKDER